MPSISPEYASKETSLSTSMLSAFLQDRPETFRRSERSFTSGRSMLSSTLLPTIISVSEETVASEVFTVATYSPLRRMATLSEMARTSCSLWVIMIMVLPAACILRMTENSLSVSCGVSTAVGSSRMSMSAPL